MTKVPRRLAVLASTRLGALLLAACGGVEVVSEPASRVGRPEPDVVCESSPCVRELAAGAGSLCARLDSGEVLCWGDNEDGSSGVPAGDATGDTGRYLLVPTPVPGVQARRIWGGWGGTCVEAVDGALACWGYEPHRGWHSGPDAQYDALVPLGLSGEGVADVVLSLTHLCVLRRDGVVLCRGDNFRGQLGRQPSADPRASDYEEVLAPLGGAQGIQRLSVDHQMTCAVTETKRVQCWGASLLDYVFGPAGSQWEPIDLGLEQVQDLAASDTAACVLHTDGTAACWGSPADEVTRFPEGTPDGSSRVWPPLPVLGVEEGQAAEVSGFPTGHFACVLNRDGTVSCWGGNKGGQLGRGFADEERHVEAERVPGLDSVVQLALGGSFACALLHDGQVRCWGGNGLGQLGIGVRDETHVERGLSEPLWPQ